MKLFDSSKAFGPELSARDKVCEPAYAQGLPLADDEFDGLKKLIDSRCDRFLIRRGLKTKFRFGWGTAPNALREAEDFLTDSETNL